MTPYCFYCCPSCGEKEVHELDNPKVLYCKCGFTWRTFSSDIHYVVKTDKKQAIREVLDNAIQYYHRKADDEFNQMKERRKQMTINYLVDEIIKGPIKGGTMAKPYSVCDEFTIWPGLQRSILIRDESCQICGIRPSSEVHHIRPRHLKGTDHPRNLIGLCPICHDEVHRRIDEGIRAILEGSLDIPMAEGQKTLEESIGVSE